jgi:TRAP-type C4-dicarboxylate transport system permease small subunit
MQKTIAIVFIVLGAAGLAYGGFSYTSDVHDADMGSLHMSFSEKEHVNIPIWAGVAFIVVGGALLVIRKKI